MRFMRIGNVSLSLLLATALALAGNGLLATLVAMRLVDGGVAEQTSGLILAAYFAGLTLGTLVLAPTIQRVGSARAFTAFTALHVSVCLAHGFLAPGPFWAVLRGVTGFAMAGLYLTVESWLNAGAGPAERGRVMAGYLIALYVGTTLGQLLLPIWPETGFEALAAAALATSLAAIPISLTRMPEPVLPGAARLPISELSREAPIGWAGAWLSGFLVGGIYATIPLSARASGLDASEIAALMTAFVVGGLAGQWPIGSLSDRIDRRLVLLLVSVLLAACCLLSPMLEHAGAAMRTAAAFAFGALAFSLYPLAVAHTLDRIGPQRALPAASLVLLASSVGSIVAPAVLPMASTALGPQAFYALNGALASGFAVVIGWRLLRVRRVAQDHYQPVPRTTPVVYELDPRIEGLRATPPRTARDPAPPAGCSTRRA
jgi:MFS family permease